MNALSRSRLRAWRDALAFSSTLAALVAGGLVTLATLAFGLPVEARVVGLATAGTLVVYNIDRLRDRTRDRQRAPKRTAFVDRNHGLLIAMTGLGAALCAACALGLAPTAWALCSVVFVTGLFHRRLKGVRGIKTAYLTLCWLAIVSGLPLLAHWPPTWPGGARFYWVVTTLGCALLANLVASNLDRQRADEGMRWVDPSRRLGPAIAIAGLGVGMGVVAPEGLRALACVPAAEFIALTRFRAGEDDGALVVDGALLIGVGGAIAMAWATGGFSSPG